MIAPALAVYNYSHDQVSQQPNGQKVARLNAKAVPKHNLSASVPVARRKFLKLDIVRANGQGGRVENARIVFNRN